MIITCGECDSSFVLDDSLVKPSGSKVRCSNCKNVFVAYPPAPKAQEEKEEPILEKSAEVPPPAGDDPDFTKAVEAINEDELEFTDEELGIDAKAAAAEEKEELAEEPAFEEPVAEEEELLDFADFELDVDTSDVPAETPAVDSEEEELDFSDLELELGGDEEPAADDGVSLDLGDDISEEADTVAMEGGDLDFSDLDLDITPPPASEEEAGLEDLDLIDEDTEHAPEVMLDEEELDFSDLELALEDSSEDLDDEPASVEDLDIEMDMEESGVEPETVLIDEEDLDFSDFELDLDESQDEETAETQADEAEEELDFSDLADILDSDQAPAEEEVKAEEDLDLELDLDTGEQPEELGGEAEEADEELDFSDLENMLDDVDQPQEEAEGGAAEDFDLELDLSMDDESEEEEQSLELSADEDTDFSDVEAMLGSDEGLGEEDISLSLDTDQAEDIELELDIDQDEVGLPDEPEFKTPVIEESEEVHAVAEPEEKPDKKKKGKDKPKRKAAGKGKLFVKLFLIVLFLLFTAFAVYLSSGQIEDRFGYKMFKIGALEDVRDKINGMDIPFLSDWVKPQPKDPEGKLGLKTLRITGKIVPNEKIGDIFVITGKVQNMYQGTRNSIRLLGKLFGSGDKVAQTKGFYAGNVISEKELLTMDGDAIEKRLQNRLGDNDVNMKVRPGQVVSFMVVFTNLSEDLSEFSVEPAGSSQGAAIK